MTLEDRVRVLEDEVGILKDQIRNTLLEIQEQILIHYYPSLRADPSPADGGALLSRGNPTARNASTFTGLQRVAIDSSGPTPEEPERDRPSLLSKPETRRLSPQHINPLPLTTPCRRPSRA